MRTLAYIGVPYLQKYRKNTRELPQYIEVTLQLYSKSSNFPKSQKRYQRYKLLGLYSPAYESSTRVKTIQKYKGVLLLHWSYPTSIFQNLSNLWNLEKIDYYYNFPRLHLSDSEGFIDIKILGKYQGSYWT